MVDIGISEIKVIAKSEDIEHRSIKYDAEAIIRPEKCANPACGLTGLKMSRHDSKPYLLHDVKAEGKLAYINLKIRRYKCPRCGYVFPEEFNFFTKREHMTHRLKDEIVTRCIKGETFRYIANDYSIDPNTVASIFKEYATAHKDELVNDYTPEVLGIDEAHIDDHYRLVLTDVKEQKLLDLKRDNKPATVNAYLRTLDKAVCTCVTMDFAPAYAKSVSLVLPSALVVIDKFHAVQEVNKCLDNVRKDLQNYYRSQGNDIRRFKRSKYLFMTNWEDLTPGGFERLSQWFDEFYELYDAYMCKETFRDIYSTAETKEKAAILFDAWLDAIPDFERFKPMEKTMRKRRDHLLNYWDAPYTNAYTESVNNAIKKIEKAGRGYKFETLRERCLLEINSAKPEKFNPRKATYIQTASCGMPEKKKSEKINKLYAPKAGLSTGESVPKATPGSYNFDFTFSPQNAYDPMRQVRNGSLWDYLTVYLEMNDFHHRKMSYQKRMIYYYERLRELNL